MELVLLVLVELEALVQQFIAFVHVVEEHREDPVAVLLLQQMVEQVYFFLGEQVGLRLGALLLLKVGLIEVFHCIFGVGIADMGLDGRLDVPLVVLFN